MSVLGLVGVGFRVYGRRFCGLGCRFWGSGCRFWGLGFRVGSRF